MKKWNRAQFKLSELKLRALTFAISTIDKISAALDRCTAKRGAR
jgi:hypothetical protein